ncbi:MAG TPA: STAS domain-containing protein [Acidimicrobiia bacterium]|jgi:anti-sigma B factor antagonist|nr:STAS domain-containing protein [Acidimicrobiia bacterium]
MALAWQSSAWVDVGDEQGAVVLRVGGELDEASRSAVEPAVMAAVQSASHVILDLGSLTFCDSSGIAMIVQAAETARQRDCRIAVDHATPTVRRIFDIANLGEIVDLRQ